jgi:hypothetical protein
MTNYNGPVVGVVGISPPFLSGSTAPQFNNTLNDGFFMGTQGPFSDSPWKDGTKYAWWNLEVLAILTNLWCANIGADGLVSPGAVYGGGYGVIDFAGTPV